MIRFRARAIALFLGIPTIVTSAAAQPAPPSAKAAAAPSASASAAPSASASAAPSASASAAPSASAQAAAAGPSKEDRERANALMDEGDEDVKRGDLAAALDVYQKAHAIMHVPTTGIEVARTLDKLGKLMDALVATREVLAMPVVAGEPKQFTEARDEAKALLATLEERVPTLTIVVTGVPGRTPVDVTLDGRKLTADELAAPLQLAPGKYRVLAKADEHTPAFADITLKERDRAQAALALARVLIIGPDPTATATAPPPPPPPGLSPLVPIGFSIAGASILVGAITGGLALSAASEANTRCPKGLCRSDGDKTFAQGRYGAADALAIAADVAFVLGLGGAAIGIYGVASPPSARPATPPPAALILGPGSAHLRFHF